MGIYKTTRKDNPLTYIDAVKIFAKDKKELETLIQTIRIYNKDIAMEFGRQQICSAYKEK